MDRIEHYLAAARSQMERIWSRVDMLSGPAQTSRQREHFAQTFCEIHFYFICWEVVAAMLKELKLHSGLAAAHRVWRRHSRVLERYCEARRHLENIAEQLSGRTANTVLQQTYPSDFAYLHGRYFAVDGKRWDVSRSSLKRLEAIVSDVNKQLRAEAISRHQSIVEREKSASRTRSPIVPTG